MSTLGTHNTTTVSGATTATRTLTGVSVDDLMTFQLSFNPAAITGLAITDNRANTWVTDEIVKAGSNPPNRLVTISYAVATAVGDGSVVITATWTESANAHVGAAAWAVTGTGDIQLVAAGDYEQLSEVTNSHFSAADPGLSFQDHDVVLGFGAADGSSTNSAGTGYTSLHTGNSAQLIYKLPTGSGQDRAPWTGTNNRRVAAVMAVFGRRAGAPAGPTIIYPRITRRRLPGGLL